MVRMLISDQLNFPNLTDWAKTTLPLVHKNEKVWTAFKTHGQLNSFTAFQAVNWIDDSPLMKIKSLGGTNGTFDPDKPNAVVLAKEIADRFEIDHELEKARLLVESTVLHELVHWGDHRDGRDQSGEEGKAFEKAAYGRDIGRYWLAPVASANIREADIPALGSHERRGLRNNNPGNIEIGDDWEGLAEREEMTPAQREETRFCVFKHPKFGIRAMGKILINYQKLHDLRTVEGMIHRWAPPSDNNHTGDYIRLVTARMGIEKNREFDFTKGERAVPMVEAMIVMENGRQPYPDEMVEEGLRLAGVEIG